MILAYDIIHSTQLPKGDLQGSYACYHGYRRRVSESLRTLELVNTKQLNNIYTVLDQR